MSARNKIIEDFHIFTDNPTPRVPICLCLDLSGSMQGSRIQNLNEGVQKFLKEIKQDDVAAYAADICIIGFGDNGVQIITDFTHVEAITPPQLIARGGTPMGEAVQTAIERLQFRKGLYKNVGNPYYQPWLVLMTDGESTDDISKAVEQVKELVLGRKLTVLPIAIGGDVGEGLTQFAIKTPVIYLNELKFHEFFQWLSKSVGRVSVSSSEVDFNFRLDIISWGDLATPR